MTHRNFRSVATTTLLLTSWLAAANVQAEEAFVPPPEVKRTVDAFVGRWSLDGTFTMPGEATKKATLKMDCRAAAKGKGVTCTMTGIFDASILVAYDFYSKAVHFMAVTSDDEVHDHKCRWQGDQKLVCDPLKGGMSGMAITEDLSFTVGGKKLGFEAATTLPDGRKATCAFTSK
jgi:hypothetical protein